MSEYVRQTRFWDLRIRLKKEYSEDKRQKKTGCNVHISTFCMSKKAFSLRAGICRG